MHMDKSIKFGLLKPLDENSLPGVGVMETEGTIEGIDLQAIMMAIVHMAAEGMSTTHQDVIMDLLEMSNVAKYEAKTMNQEEMEDHQFGWDKQ